MNRRKLGSNRRREGRQNVKQPEPEQDPEPRNYVQEETRRFEPQETRVSAATQLEIQEESGHEKHSSLSAKHDPSFVSTMTCKYSEVKTSSAMPCSEDAFKTAVGKDGNMQACKETKLEVPEADDSAQREGIKENMHQCLPEWHSLNISTLPSLEHEIIKQEDSCTFSVAERKSKKKYDEGLSVQDESLQGNYPVRESHVRTLVSDYFMPETTTDNSIITVDRESENSTEQTVVLLPSRELSTNEYAEELFKLPKVRDGVLTEETLKKMGKKDKKLTQMQHLHQIAAQSTVLHATEDYDAPKNIEFEINTHRFQLVAKVTDEQNPWAAKENNVDEINDSDPKQIRKSQLVPSVSLFEGGEFVEEDKLGAEQSIHQKTDFFEGEKNDFSVNSPLLDLNAPDFPLQAKSSSTDEQNNSNLKFGGARLKLVSSQRNKGRQHVKDIKDDVMGDEAFETSKVSFKIKTEDLKNLSETELSVLSSVSNGNSISLKNWPAHYSEVQTFEPTKNPTTEPQSLILTGEEHPRSHDKKRPNTKKEKVEELVDITQKEVVAESLPCENAKDVHSAELQGAEVYASQTQQHLITVKGYATQTCEIFSGNLTGCVEMTEPTIISTDDSDTKLDENIVEAVVQKSKNMDVHYTNQSKISDVDMANSGQVHDLKDRVEDVQEPNTKLIFSKKKGVHFYSEKDSVNVQSEMVDEKVYIGALTKLKEPQQLDYASGTVMDDAQDYVEIVGNVDSQSKISAMMQSRFAEKSDDETATKEKVLLKSGTIIFAAENVDLEVVGHRNKDDSANVSQQTMIHRIGEETMNYKSRTFVERDVTQNAGKGIFSEADRKEVSVVSPLPHLNAPPDLQLQNKSLSTDKKADANFSLSENRRKLGSGHKKKRRKSSKESKEEYLESTNEDKEVETSQLLKIQTAEQEDSSKGNEHKIMSTSQDSSMSLMSESQRIFPENENLEHDQEKRKLDIGTTMITSDVISETTQRKVQEIKVHPKQMKESLQTGYPESLTGHAEMSMLTMKSGGDDSGVKEVDYPTTRNILDDSDLKSDDYDLSDTEKQPIRDTVDSSLSQVYEFKVRVEDEVKPNTEQMFHQEKERLFSEPEDKSASTLQSETFSSESQPQKDSETKDEQTSRAFSSSDRRKLGSSRRNKRGQRVKEPTDEVLENSKADEIPENSKVSLEIVTFEQKYSHQDTDHIFMTSVSQNRSVSLMPLSGHSSQVLSSDPPDYLETIPQSLPDSEQDSEDHSDRESSVFANLVKKSTNFSQQEVDKYLTASTRDLLGDDQRIKVHSTQQSLHTCYSPVSGDTENLDIFSGNLSEQAEMFGFTKKSESASTDELYPTKVRMSVASDLKPGTENPHAGDSALSQVHQPGSVRDPTTSGHKRKLASSRRLKGGHTVKDPDAETHDKPVQDLVEEASSFRLIESSDITPRRAHSTSNVDQKVPNGSMIQDGDLSSRKRDERTELPTKDKNSHENVLASKPHSFPFTTDVNSEINTSRDRTISENIAGSKSPKNDAYESSQHAIDAVRKAQVQEVDPGQVCAEKEKGEAVGKNEKTAQKSFYLTENKEMFDFVSSGRDFSVASEGTTEKSIPRNHNEIECSVEQKAYSSPQDRLPTAGEQDKSINISEAARKHQLEDFVSKEHAEQINPDQMQETCHIDSTSLVQNTSFVQTLQSDANVAVDFNCADHDQSNKNETHSDLKAAEGRRKLGSSRRIKGRQQAKFSETNQENKEEDNEITDEATQMSATKTSREDFKPVEKVTTIVAEAEQTEKLPTTLGGSSVSTPEINSSSDKDDFTKSNKNTDEKHIELLHGTDSFCLITHCGLEKEGLMQSQSFVSEGDSDLQSSLKHDEIISILSGSESVFDQDQTIQRQNREARTLGQGVELQQMLEDTQTARGFSSEDHDRNSSVDAQEPRLDELRENLLRAERGLSTSLEFISPSEESAMDLAYKKAISLKVDASEGLQETSMFKKRKIGSSRRTKINRKQEGETPSMDEPKDDDISTQDDVWNLEKVEVMVELPLIKEVKESLNVHNLHGARENDEAKTTRYDKHQQAVPEQRSKSTSEGVQSQALEVKSSSPDFSSTSRRKMGSTCKNLGSQTQREILHQGEEPKIEAAESETPAGGAASERILQIKGVRLHSENKDSDQRTEKAFQPVEITHVEESLLKPPAEETPDESPVSLSQVDETKQTLHISPSSSPQNDSVLKSVRRKKFGSNRRSHLQQRNKNQDEKEDGVIQIHNEDHTREIVEEAADRNRDESPDLDKISEVLEKSSSNLPETKELSEPVSEKTPGRSYHDEICFSQDSRRQNSLGNLGGANASDSYNVVMIGDSCVGKTSFMKRAQSGKFSLDIPASVGVDSCMWTVVVDGKPVMLQLWDTAGQERFHSVTRQVFHRAQAFLLMYDITCSQSFSAVSYWVNCIQEAAAEDVSVLLLGNKSDDEQRRVKTEEGDNLAKEYNFAFMECSAATGQNVIESLETMARMLSQSADLREKTTQLHKQPAQKKQSSCC